MPIRERPVPLEGLAENVNRQVKADGRCVVVVSEGFPAGELGEEKDAFGHTSFGASRITVQQRIVNYLNEHGIQARGAARGHVPGTDQRDSAIYASIPDLDEAYRVGQKAALVAMEDGSGWMSTILREPGPIYSVRYDKVPLEEVANSERAFPEGWITESGYDVTDEFIEYARPLVGEDWPSVPVVAGRQRFARLAPAFAQKKLPAYEISTG